MSFAPSARELWELAYRCLRLQGKTHHWRSQRLYEWEDMDRWMRWMGRRLWSQFRKRDVWRFDEA